ncbi:MAG: hypothetical protein QOJ40_534 [Verrucomicrobiota bacterium]
MKTSNFKLQTSGKFQVSNSKQRSHRCGAWCLMLIWSLAPGAWSFCSAATNTFDFEAIPPLRPPRAEIPPTFWEQHGLWVVIGSIALLAVICGAVWLSRRPSPPMTAPPAVRARQALEQLQRRPEDGIVLSWVSQILRHYLTDAFDLAPEELTMTEFCDLIAKNEKIGSELSAEVAQFLRVCDERKFAASASKPTLGAAAQALELIEHAEARHAQLRQLDAKLST